MPQGCCRLNHTAHVNSRGSWGESCRCEPARLSSVSPAQSPALAFLGSPLPLAPLLIAMTGGSSRPSPHLLLGHRAKCRAVLHTPDWSRWGPQQRAAAVSSPAWLLAAVASQLNFPEWSLLGCFGTSSTAPLLLPWMFCTFFLHWS